MKKLSLKTENRVLYALLTIMAFLTLTACYHWQRAFSQEMKWQELYISSGKGDGL